MTTADATAIEFLTRADRHEPNTAHTAADRVREAAVLRRRAEMLAPTVTVSVETLGLMVAALHLVARHADAIGPDAMRTVRQAIELAEAK